MTKQAVAYLTLFTSLSTLVCCAIPALFVALGFGAAFAALVSTVPQLIWFSEHKCAVFITAGAFLTAGAWSMWRQRNHACPVDPALGAACSTARAANEWLFGFSLAAYLVGGFFAFGAPYLF